MKWWLAIDRLRSSAFICGFSFLLCVSAAPAQEHAACAAPAPYVAPERMQRPIGLVAGIGALHQKVGTGSKQAQSYYDQGISYLSSYVWIEAARSFHEAARLDPDLAMAHLGLAKAYAAVDAGAEAQRHLEHAERLAAAGETSAAERAWIDAARLQVDAMQANGDARAAKHETYKRAVDALIAIAPGDPNAWVLRGNAEEPGPWGRGQFGGVSSIAYYETALRRDPGHIGAHHYLTHSYENIGQHDIAAQHGRLYAGAASAVPHAQHMYGHVLPRLGRWKEALGQFEKAHRLHLDAAARGQVDLQEDWHYGHNLHLLATMHLRLGNEDEARKYFRESFELQMQGRFAGVYNTTWIEYLLWREKFSDALAGARRLEERTGPAAAMLGAALAGEALLGLERLQEARAALSRATEARRNFIAAMEGSAMELGAPAFADHFVGTLDGLLGLRGEEPESARARLLALADQLAGSSRFDSWAFGIFWLQRLARDARRDGDAELAQALEQRLARIDPYIGSERANETAE